MNNMKVPTALQRRQQHKQHHHHHCRRHRQRRDVRSSRTKYVPLPSKSRCILTSSALTAWVARCCCWLPSGRKGRSSSALLLSACASATGGATHTKQHKTRGGHVAYVHNPCLAKKTKLVGWCLLHVLVLENKVKLSSPARAQAQLVLGRHSLSWPSHSNLFKYSEAWWAG